mmetsp:Transcript_13251/g.30755  ORF Transcript_13251/g.30755 Transcript_13251/m.30755 type:complete len:231 (+) Transcript_13251:830-1522(+)
MPSDQASPNDSSQTSSVRTFLPVAASQNMANPSRDPLTKCFRSSVKHTLCTFSQCPSRSVRTSCPVAAFQILTVLSYDPLTTRFPSGEKEIDITRFECPESVNNSAPVSAFQSLTSSSAPLTTRVPSGEKATEYTSPACPFSVHTTDFVFTSQISTRFSERSPLSLEPLAAVTTRFPSGENAAENTRVWSVSVHPVAPVLASQMMTWGSLAPLTTRVPSGEKMTERTAPE